MATHPQANHDGNLCRIFARGMQSVIPKAMPLACRRAKTDSFHKVPTVDQQELAGHINLNGLVKYSTKIGCRGCREAVC